MGRSEHKVHHRLLLCLPSAGGRLGEDPGTVSEGVPDGSSERVDDGMELGERRVGQRDELVGAKVGGQLGDWAGGLEERVFRLETGRGGCVGEEPG